MYYVYVLVSETTNKRYIGQTDNLSRRIQEHNTPSHNPRKYTTRHAGPWVLVHREEYPTRAEAMQREKWLKSGVGRAWLDSIMAKSKDAQRS